VSTRPRDWEKVIQKRIKEGRGRGVGPTYNPWIHVKRSEAPPKSRNHLYISITVGQREHNLLSDLEQKGTLFLDFSADVQDIREQFPLFPRKLGLDLAEKLGIVHPRYPNSTVPIVLSIDSLLTLSDGQPLALDFKYLEEASTKTHLARLELNRRFCELFNIPWFLVLEKNIPDIPYTNLVWLRQNAVLKSSLQKYLRDFVRLVSASWKRGELLRDLITSVSIELSLEENDSYNLFKHAVWAKQLQVDFDAPLSPTEPLHLRSDKAHPKAIFGGLHI